MSVSTLSTAAARSTLASRANPALSSVCPSRCDRPALATASTRKSDYGIFCGEWCIGRIYETRTGPADLRWFWALHAPGGRETFAHHSRVATLEIAKAEFDASWKHLKGVGEEWRR